MGGVRCYHRRLLVRCGLIVDGVRVRNFTSPVTGRGCHGRASGGVTGVERAETLVVVEVGGLGAILAGRGDPDDLGVGRGRAGDEDGAARLEDIAELEVEAAGLAPEAEDSRELVDVVAVLE